MISVIIPVYNAESTIQKSIESLIYGAYKDLEVILIDDCSTDRSWDLCQKAAKQFDAVKCYQNERTSGVSFTRNQGLEKASGELITFVNCSDWVSGRFLSRLAEAYSMYPDKMILCGHHLINQMSGYERDYLWDQTRNEEYSIVCSEHFFELADAFLLQPIWNKLFIKKIIDKHSLRFDVNCARGEDDQFVCEYMDKAAVSSCIVINEPLYYYIYLPEAADLHQKHSVREKMAEMNAILKGFSTRLKGKVIQTKNKVRAAILRRRLRNTSFSLISQNCIGGIAYHDMGLQFLSPTINLYFTSQEFLRFANHLEYYLKQPITMQWGEKYPIGHIEDISIYFQHYDTCSAAAEAWERRKARVILEKVIVLATDRDGFKEEYMTQWEQIKYPKILFSSKNRTGTGVLYYPKWHKNDEVGDLITDRSMYRENRLLNTINSL